MPWMPFVVLHAHPHPYQSFARIVHFSVSAQALDSCMLAVARSARHIQQLEGITRVRSVAVLPCGVLRWMMDHKGRPPAHMTLWTTEGIKTIKRLMGNAYAQTLQHFCNVEVRDRRTRVARMNHFLCGARHASSSTTMVECCLVGPSCMATVLNTRVMWWCSLQNWLDADLVLAPLLHHGHFSLCCIHTHTHPRRVELHDSLGGHETVQLFAETKGRTKKKQKEACLHLAYLIWGMSRDEVEVSCELVQHGTQTDSETCGLWTVLFAYMAICGRLFAKCMLPINTNAMNQLREPLAASALSGKLLIRFQFPDVASSAPCVSTRRHKPKKRKRPQ